MLVLTNSNDEALDMPNEKNPPMAVEHNPEGSECIIDVTYVSADIA